MKNLKVVAANKWLIGTVTAGLIASATLWEGVKYEPYVDMAGVPTVCMGYTGPGIIKGKRYSHEECNDFLRKELIVHGNGVLSCITRPLKINEYNAFTLMAYNIGVGGFCSSRAARLFNAGLNEQACDAIAHGPNGKPAWSYINGNTFVRGLYNRRLYERSMCLGDKVVYKS